MLHVAASSWRAILGLPLLTRAFTLSLMVHLLVFALLETANRVNLLAWSPLAALVKAFQANTPKRNDVAQKDPKKLAPVKEEVETEIPLLFVDVSPAQAVQEVPKKTPYYAVVNTVAGNPDVSKAAETPKFEGNQNKVLKTTDTAERAPVPHPLQPAVVPDQATAAQAQPKVDPVPKQEEEAEEKPAPKQAAQPVGDLAMIKPPSEEKKPAEAAKPVRERPRTLAAAQAQRIAAGDNSALLGEKMKTEGGVKRFTVQSSLDARATPFSAYDAKFIAAVQECWYGLLDQQRYSLDRVGKVVLEFRLTQDGRVMNMNTLETDVGDIYTTICQLAVTKPAPFDKWPSDMQRLIGKSYREVRFTFYY